MNVLIASLAQYAVPLVVLIIGYICHIVVVHIPAQQRAYITQWADVAVLKAEQFGAGKTSAEKKQLAMDTLSGFFKAFNLPLPSSDILSSFIEAAVNQLPTTSTPVVGTTGS
ncbi:MAG TPA: phage holin, LLH family [Patescibacteria group bacterium]